MDLTLLFLLCLLFSPLILLCFKTFFNNPKIKLPPGPTPLPLVGNLFELGHKPHESLAKLANIYGPLMTLKLGTVTSVIISSPATAKQALQAHDHVLASRTVPDAIRSLDHHHVSVAWLPPDQNWRRLRKLCNLQIFTAQRLGANEGARRRKIADLLDFVRHKTGLSEAIDIGQSAFVTALNLISNTLFSIDLANLGGNEATQEFKWVVRGVMDEVGRPNVSDYFPVLIRLDPQGIRRRTTLYFEKLDKIFDGLIEQRLQAKGASRDYCSSNDLLDALIDHYKEDDSNLSLLVIKGLLKDIFVAGTDTSSSTLEWAMAELLHNPQTMAKAQAELRETIEKGKMIEESDISSLPYLQAIVKETLRLHPPVPFLLPRRAESDIELCGGFTVSKNAQVLVNVWAIGRDGDVWRNPNCFDPERFMGSEIGFKGRDFELLPFGAGRRICPGLPLADRMVHLVLASLLHSFDWELENGLRPEDLNMDEKFGLTLQKAQPLMAVPVQS